MKRYLLITICSIISNLALAGPVCEVSQISKESLEVTKWLSIVDVQDEAILLLDKDMQRPVTLYVSQLAEPFLKSLNFNSLISFSFNKKSGSLSVGTAELDRSVQNGRMVHRALITGKAGEEDFLFINLPEQQLKISCQ